MADDLRLDVKMLSNLVADDYCTALGRVMAQWSHLEFFLDLMIWMSARASTLTSRVITTNLATQAKLELLRTLVHENGYVVPGLDAELVYIQEKLLPTRNDIIHATMFAPKGFEGVMLRYVAKGKLKAKNPPASVDQLKEFSMKIVEASARLFDHGRFLPKLSFSE